MGVRAEKTREQHQLGKVTTPQENRTASEEQPFLMLSFPSSHAVNFMHVPTCCK